MLDPQFYRNQHRRFAHENQDRAFVLDVRAVISIEDVRTVDLSLNTGPSLQGRCTIQEFVSKTEGSLGNKDTIRVQGAIRLLQGAAILALDVRD